MKISLYDFIFICLGFIYGTYVLFVDQNHRYSNDITGILSFVISFWVLISCARSEKGKAKP
jgi:hypothetical protein